MGSGQASHERHGSCSGKSKLGGYTSDLEGREAPLNIADLIQDAEESSHHLMMLADSWEKGGARMETVLLSRKIRDFAFMIRSEVRQYAKAHEFETSSMAAGDARYHPGRLRR